jgi:histidyl-tRNA synthetase
VETPAIEYTDALGKFLPDQDRPNEGVFSFQDDDEQWLSLRYDLTAPLARYVAENFDTLPKPYRSYRVGWVFRNEKPGPGRFRQFMQFDADTVGSASPAADAEMCMMAADTMEALGIPRGSYVVKVWHREILEGLKETAGLSNEKQWLTVLRAIDKRDRVKLTGVQQLLSTGRKDESGDFTQGARISVDANNFIISSISSVNAITSSTELIPRNTLIEAENAIEPEFDFNDFKAKILNHLQGKPLPNSYVAGSDQLKQIKSLCDLGGYSDRVKISKTVIRGLEYYTGPVFEVELTFATDGKDGSPRFGSVGGGGRYDGLV